MDGWISNADAISPKTASQNGKCVMHSQHTLALKQQTVFVFLS